MALPSSGFVTATANTVLVGIYHANAGLAASAAMTAASPTLPQMLFASAQMLLNLSYG